MWNDAKELTVIYAGDTRLTRVQYKVQVGYCKGDGKFDINLLTALRTIKRFFQGSDEAGLFSSTPL